MNNLIEHSPIRTHQHGIKGRILYKDHLTIGDSKVNQVDDKYLKQKDPLRIKESRISGEYYTIVWEALKINAWDNKEAFGKEIYLTPHNYKILFIEFIAFSLLMLITVNIITIESINNETVYILPVTKEVFRILLLLFGHIILSSEFIRGWHKIKYTLDNIEEFSHPKFAIFVGFQQMLISFACYYCTIIYICTLRSVMQMVMGFVSVAVLLQFDDWLGDMILKEYPLSSNSNLIPDDLEEIDINKEMGVNQKLSLLRDDIKLVLDYNYKPSSSLVIYSIISYIPSIIIPIVFLYTIEFLLKQYHSGNIIIIN